MHKNISARMQVYSRNGRIIMIMMDNRLMQLYAAEGAIVQCFQLYPRSGRSYLYVISFFNLKIPPYFLKINVFAEMTDFEIITMIP